MMMRQPADAVLCVMMFLLITFAAIDRVGAQTFLDRRNPDAVRVVSYNVHFDDLFEGQTSAGELSRMISAVDADVYNFQEAFDTTAAEVGSLFNTFAPLGNGNNWRVHKGRNQVIVSRFGLSIEGTDVPNGTRGIAMAQVDLPDTHFDNDLFILNNHFPCCDGGELQRQAEAEAIAAWIQDATTTGGNLDLEPGTGIAVLGDLNIVSGPTPLNTLLNGRNGLSPDWDGTGLADARPVHNATGTEDWTWRDDTSVFEPSTLDFVLYTDSVLQMDYGYVLNPSVMSAADLSTSGLRATDFALDKANLEENQLDHLPVIVDFVAVAVPEPSASVVLVLLCGVAGIKRRKNV